MRLIEYESKEILAKRGIPTPAGIVISRSEPVSLPPPGRY
jgi:succinyl-CoA synthetase beta subunit